MDSLKKLILSLAMIVVCCESYGKATERWKREAPPAFVNMFFANCLTSKSSSNVNWNSIVDYIILHTSWFENSDVGSCAPNNPDVFDEANCWKDAFDKLMSPSSPDLQHVRDCIDEFVAATNKRRRRDVDEAFPFIAATLLENFNCPSVDPAEFAALLEEQVLAETSSSDFLPHDQVLEQLQSVVEFVRKEAICIEPTCDRCNANYANAFDPSEELECNECWPTRFAGMIKDSSPLKNISTAIALAFEFSDAQIETEIDCGASDVKISVGKNDTRTIKLKYNERMVVWGSEVSDVNEVDPKCRSFNDTQFCFNMTSCQPIVEMGDQFIKYVYTIRKVICTPDGEVVRRFVDGCIDVTCTYNRSSMVDTGPIVPLTRKVILSDDDGQGQFSVQLGFYDDQFENPLPVNSEITVPDFVNVLGRLDLEGDAFVLQALECWATSDADRDSDPQFPLVVNGCAATDSFEGSNAIEVIQNGMQKEIEFKFRSFVWVDAVDLAIYVHCHVRVCDTDEEDCSFTCSKRRRRSPITPSSGQSMYMSVGPLRVIGELQPDSCEVENGGCSDICGIAEGRIICLCRPGMVLADDGKTCVDTAQVNKHRNDLPIDHQVDPALIAVVVVLALLSCWILISKLATGMIRKGTL